MTEMLTTQAVQDAIGTAVAKAEELAVHVSVAVVDQGGALRGFLRMDEAPLASIEFARRKAYTAAAVRMSTADLFDLLSQPENTAMLIGFVAQPDVTVFGGGHPIQVDGRVIGAIGVGGAEDAAIDVEIAVAAAAVAV
jgi:uncharacterized protein GlcG (DUF336 family)